jgi:hypothetical protein
VVVNPEAGGKLASEFIDALQADFEQHGAGVIAKVRTEKPDVYLKVVANLMPAKMEATLNVNVFEDYDLQDAKQFAQAYRLARSMIGASGPPIIEIESERRDVEFGNDD